MIVKMCGIRRKEDAAYANEVCPDYVGFVFADSPRKVSVEEAVRFRKDLRKEIRCVGVFVNETPEQMAETAARVPLDALQLHGDETEEDIRKLRSLCDKEIWKAARVKSAEDIQKVQMLPADRILLDSFSKEAYGGTGRTIRLDILIRIPGDGFLHMENERPILRALHWDRSVPFFRQGNGCL